MKGLLIRNTYVQYKSPITTGKKVMAKVKVFVHAIDADADADADADTDADRDADVGAVTLAPPT